MIYPTTYNKLVRPVVNVSEAVTVRLKLKLSQLIDVVRSFIKFMYTYGMIDRLIEMHNDRLRHFMFMVSPTTTS
jgi:hypothetical protein